MPGESPARQGALKLTTATYWRPNNKNMHRFPDSKPEDDWGVKPSEGLALPLSDDDFRRFLLWRSERDVVRHKVRWWRYRSPLPDYVELRWWRHRDRVLDKALEHLRSGPG